jgi:alpha-tubulin suppressor-like RCC1 family protein
MSGVYRTLSPANTASITTATQVAAGARHSCALLQNGSVQCWGDNGDGQLGNGNTTDQLVPASVGGGLSGVAEIYARGARTYARTSGGVLYAWGSSCDGKLGIAGMTSCGAHSTPLMVTGGISKLAVGYDTVCALKTDNTVWCWGLGGYGNIGNGTFESVDVPTQIPNLTAMDIASGGDHVCAVKMDKTVVCWGYDGAGQLGDGQQRFDEPTGAKLVCE